MTKFTDFNATSTLVAANDRLPPIAAVVLLLVLAWQLAKLVWLLVPGAAAGDPIAAPYSATTGRGAVTADVASIAASHMFGITDAEDEVRDPGPILEDIPKTRSNLVLKGTVASNDADFSIALISTAGNEQDVFAIGDSITSRV